ncbi:MAG: hypothetical protein Phog2KO_18120 [Phototrophicaceae bacterium]
MPQIKYDCPNCKQEGIMEFEESIISSELRWYATQICGKCDFVTEQDDKGALPSHLRDIVLEDTGTWDLQIKVPLNAKLLKVIRKELNLSMNEIKNLRRPPPINVAQGTHIEMQLIKRKLAQSLDESILLLKRDHSD